MLNSFTVNPFNIRIFAFNELFKKKNVRTS